ncbi:hypothetical protein ABFU26_10985 [Xanthomonas campestris pv. raphani]|uniref:hypothetical protein n=1 Tax=Xanthomonas TaxID=338 RepID=UPI0005751DC8|nr:MULTISPECIES: hypothetical protein [Xanthomonas]KHL57072.1 hypothetical protein OZ10_07430 [Xanthomonas cannabis pv. cannabis]MCC8553637.1 hypothetical protein [Xanthomonas hortorum pv. gardneri]
MISVSDILLTRKIGELFPRRRADIASAYANAHLQWTAFQQLPAVEPDEYKIARYLTVLSLFCDKPNTKAAYRQAAQTIVALHAEFKGF